MLSAVQSPLMDLRTAAEDIYDSRGDLQQFGVGFVGFCGEEFSLASLAWSLGYAVRKDWVNGPNKVFRFILSSSDALRGLSHTAAEMIIWQNVAMKMCSLKEASWRATMR